MAALRTLLHTLVSLAAHAIHAQLVKHWPEVRQSGRSVKLSELGAMMRAQRQLRGISQATASEDCGIQRSMFARIEQGGDVRAVELLVRLCNWLGIDPREIDYEVPHRRPMGVPALDLEGVDHESSPTRRHAGVEHPCDSTGAVADGADTAGPDRGADAAEQ